MLQGIGQECTFPAGGINYARVGSLRIEGAKHPVAEINHRLRGEVLTEDSGAAHALV